MPRRQQFWHRRSLIIAVVLALMGTTLGGVIVLGFEVGPTGQILTWSLGAASITITLCDWRKVGRFGNAQFQAVMFGVGAVLVEAVVLAAGAALVVLLGAALLSGC